MNKYEKLIEYIINDEESKARALFHQIVVEKSRDIYESLMDEEQFSETMGGNQVNGMMDEISADEQGMAEDDDAEMDMGDDDISIDGDDDMGMDDEESMDIDMGGDIGGEDGAIEDRVMDLEQELDALKAEFEQLMGGEAGEEEHSDMDMGDEEPMGDQEPMGDEGDEDMGMMEAKEEEEDDEEDDEEESVEESRRYKSEMELMREYVEKVTMPSNSSEGHEVGKGGSVSVNKTSITDNMKNDMGGTTANIVKGGSEQDPSGQSPKGKAGGFVKPAQEIDVAKRNVNKPGGNKGAQDFYNSKAKAKPAEGSTTDGSMSVAKDSILKRIN